MTMSGTLYEWRTCGQNNCPMCDRLNGIRQTAQFWQAGVRPGFHKGCDCQLVRVESSASSNAVRVPFSDPVQKAAAWAKPNRPRYRLPDRRVPTVQPF